MDPESRTAYNAELDAALAVSRVAAVAGMGIVPKALFPQQATPASATQPKCHQAGSWASHHMARRPFLPAGRGRRLHRGAAVQVDGQHQDGQEHRPQGEPRRVCGASVPCAGAGRQLRCCAALLPMGVRVPPCIQLRSVFLVRWACVRRDVWVDPHPPTTHPSATLNSHTHIAG